MALFGLPMSEAELALTTPARAARASGWRFHRSLVNHWPSRREVLYLGHGTVYLAAFRDWSGYLIPGERATVKVVPRSPAGESDLQLRKIVDNRSSSVVGTTPVRQR